ncbi:SAM-dependent methyltransferase [Geminicoccaceae bacterium 1502E]|nr:SAM-dependent methyltransferase [Geminicoccaceae bacterium 1502E]
MTAIGRLLHDLIDTGGPVDLACFMGLALGHPRHGYYATRDPLGQKGDFTTAPEISQLFGELIGLWCAQCWIDLKRPARLHLAEFGPGRGTLMADLLRAADTVPGLRAALQVHLVETSPALRRRQAALLGGSGAQWHDGLESLPGDAPLLAVANEFLDALPIRQFQRLPDGWHERLVGRDEQRRFLFVPSPRRAALDEALGPQAAALKPGAIVELAPAREAFVAGLAERLAAQKGAALLIDYAKPGPLGDTLQAVRAHRPVDPLTDPGEVDLTSRVDFAALAAAARQAGVAAWGPLGQGAFLSRLGIGLRLERLLQAATPAQAQALQAGATRLVAPAAMGELFQVMALAAGHMLPPGFSAEEGRGA